VSNPEPDLVCPPLLVVFAGPNGAGKSTFRRIFYGDSTVPFINADMIAAEEKVGAYEAAAMAERLRQDLFIARQSFMFETVLSDPIGAKVAFLTTARSHGYRVVVNFIGLESDEYSFARVFQRVGEGGHDVPAEKIRERFPRVLENLARVLGKVDALSIYDNTSETSPYRMIARIEGELLLELSHSIPQWLTFLDLPDRISKNTVRIP
jgi:predicted ABC-type ATPase